MEPIQCNWLLILVIHDFNDEEMDGIIEQVLQEFTSEGSIKNNKVLLIRNRTLVENELVNFKTVFQIMEQDSENSDEPLAFIFRDITETTVGFMFNEKRAWEDLLTWINNHYISKKTILITLCHGAGVGITGASPVNDNEETTEAPKPLPFNVIQAGQRLIPAQFLHPDVENYFKNKGKLKDCILADKYLVVKRNPNEEFCKKKEMLWITELANALEKGFGNRKIDIMMMANCYMQTFETGWLLRNQVRYLVAPQTVFKAYGYSFSGLLRTLNHSPEIKTKKLLKTIIPDFIVKMNGGGIDSKHLKMSTVVINDLRYYDILKGLFEQIAGILQECTIEQLNEIIKVRKTIQNSSDYPLNDSNKPEGNTLLYEYVDFKQFLTGIQHIFSSVPTFKQYSRLYNKISKQTTLHMYVGEDYTRHDQFISRKFGLQGISIFMPGNKNAATKGEIINCAYFGTKHVTVDTGTDIPLEAFVKTSSWDEFIQKYIIHLTNTNSNQ